MVCLSQSRFRVTGFGVYGSLGLRLIGRLVGRQRGTVILLQIYLYIADDATLTINLVLFVLSISAKSPCGIILT